MADMTKTTETWPAAISRAEEYFPAYTPPGGLLALILTVIAERDSVAVSEVSLATIRYELDDPAVLHEILNDHCPPQPDPSDTDWYFTAPKWPQDHTASVPVQQRRAWAMANAQGPETYPRWIPESHRPIEYADAHVESFYHRSVDVLSSTVDEPLLAECGGIAPMSTVAITGGAYDGACGRVHGPVWGRDDDARAVTTPASYKVSYEHQSVLIPAELVRPST
ncbi:hypothetical protein J2Z21_008457 [Streptomyces griseochromogenes]|uniref:Uncharacterized protein n=1 Tax=Streptomyces griseochromogenes TaxID=68214 RepID=A0A1B1B475_9ACTN|nr:hypothetical protein [Streptomyces griseochromogenes]ANP53627.1 hypothetical protein AVL59_32435 [Streptomyces griseochromogenes]MBP2055443.1 hypothetical protein [Streptomyces griseochromogenes]